MQELELDTNLLISVNDVHQIKISNQEKNHLAIHLPDWGLVSSSGFRKQFSLSTINNILHRINLLATVYINNRRVITLGKKQGIGLANLKLAYYYLNNLFTGK